MTQIESRFGITECGRFAREYHGGLAAALNVLPDLSPPFKQSGTDAAAG